MVEVSDFIEKFHGISGPLLKDRKKALHLLLRSCSTLENDEDALREIISKLHPKTYLEETYIVEFLIHFKRSRELFEHLKSGNDFAVTRILKQKWFLTAILQDSSPKYFVNDIFPQLSVIIRLKILKQILKQNKDEEFINSLFDELLVSYGSKYATVLISGCSTNKIKEFLIERNLKISFPQLKLLHDKDRSLIRFYYEEYYKKGGDMVSLESISRYLAKKDPNLFVELIVKFKIRIFLLLGRRSTKLFVKQNKDILLDDPNKYLDLNILNYSALVRTLGKDCSEFFKATFPESYKGSFVCVHNLLNEYPKKRRFYLFNELFKEVYNKDLTVAKDIVTDELLESIPDHEEREKWVKIFNNEFKYIKLKRSSEAVSELKEILFRTDDISFRKQVFENIVMACSINEDYEALLEILKLVCKRFRNAENGVLTSLLNNIDQNIKLKKLNEEHWKCIHEIILLLDIKHMSMDADIIFEYCKFQHQIGNTFENMIPLFLKCSVYLTRFEFKDENFKDENFQKTFLQLILKHYPVMDKRYIENYKTVEIVLAVREWNRKHRQDLILVSSIKTIIDGITNEIVQPWVYRGGSEMSALKYLICFEKNTEDFESDYFNNNTTLANYAITRWFLKNKPDVFKTYIDKIHSCFKGEGRYLSRFLRKFEYTGLTADIEEQYMKKLVEPELEDRDQFSQLLASTMPTENYLSLLEKYIPKRDKLEITTATPEEKTLLQVEVGLAKSVRFSKCHERALPVVFEYCKGDSLQPALYSLYSCFSRLNEEQLKPYLSLMLNKPVSLRKHTIFLAALVFPVDINKQIGEKMMEEEKDISVRNHLFKSSYKRFLSNPLDHFWKILENHMASLTVHDKETLNLITNIYDIPKTYKGKFAETVWKTLENLEVVEKQNMNEYYTNFFTNIRDFDIKHLPPNFCIQIIEKKFYEEEYKRYLPCSKFAIQFMMYSIDSRQAILSVMRIFEKYKTEYWNSRNSAEAKSSVYDFCKQIFEKVMDTDMLRVNISVEFPSILAEEWKKIFKEEESFEEYLMLEFIKLKYENDKNISVFASRIGEMFENARKNYGEHILILFRDFLQSSLDNLLDGNIGNNYNTKLIKFLRYFIEQGPISQLRYLLVIHLLPVEFNIKEFKTNYNFVLEKILEMPDPIISMSLNSRFKHC